MKQHKFTKKRYGLLAVFMLLFTMASLSFAAISYTYAFVHNLPPGGQGVTYWQAGDIKDTTGNLATFKGASISAALGGKMKLVDRYGTRTTGYVQIKTPVQTTTLVVKNVGLPHYIRFHTHNLEWNTQGWAKGYFSPDNLK